MADSFAHCHFGRENTFFCGETVVVVAPIWQREICYQPFDWLSIRLVKETRSIGNTFSST